LLTADLDFDEVPRSMRANRAVGVPYSDDEISNGIVMAHEQADAIADEIVVQGGPENLEGKRIVALIAYLQRLGTDISKPEAVTIEIEEAITPDGVETIEAIVAEEGS
jgi:cytochrome c oxidase cbb3-type subunit I/II